MNAPIYIHLHPETECIGVGCSHWFGYPALPPDMEIPVVEEDGESFALTLVCQINLANLPSNDAFPREGLLLFFADIAYYGGNWDEPAITMHPSDCKVCRVLYVPAAKMDQLQDMAPRYAETDEAKAIQITFDHEKPSIDQPSLQLLGSSSHLEWETWPEPCSDWQLLLQMDSMEGPDYQYNFIDCGVLCFLISPSALSRLTFSEVRSIILST